jgi:hypothetical protein
MKITRVRTQPYTFELTRPIGDANLPEGGTVSHSLAVFIETDEGVTGISPGGQGAQQVIHDLANSLLVAYVGCGRRWWMLCSKATTAVL